MHLLATSREVEVGVPVHTDIEIVSKLLVHPPVTLQFPSTL
jgi:hypothetical protein